jgi:multidrug efflux pump subunit AcrA (membrane-fusion protein)
MTRALTIMLIIVVWDAAHTYTQPAEPPTCEQQLAATQTMIDILRGSRDQLEQTLAEIATRLQSEVRQRQAAEARLQAETPPQTPERN